ncbi:ribonuclease H-like domain-containing protein [Tanacetum coccineum]
MKHYLAYTDYLIWEVIQNGNGPVSITTDTQGQIKVLPPRTAEEILARERERKARTTLLMDLPEDQLSKFHKITDAKEMWDAIKSRFGGNDESKKMQKYILKQQFEGFSVSNSEGLHKGYDRSLPSAWSQVSLIMRTKPGVDSLSFDDLYNNLRVFESHVKGSTASSSSNQNVAFVSKNTSSTNEVSTAYGVSNSFGHNSQSKHPSSYSFLANQSSCLQLDHEDLEQLDEFDLEEIDLIWQVAMISIRMKMFYKKTGKKLQFVAKEPVGFDKTKVECYNCHKTGHLARECKSKGNQDSRRRDAWNTGNKDKDNGRRSGKQKESKALVTLDGEGVDWTSHSEDEQENYALMAYSSSGSDTEMSIKDKDGLRSSDIEHSPVNNRYAERMHAVPPPMIGIYIPFGPDKEIDDSQFTYGPKQSKPSESDARSSDFTSCESNSNSDDEHVSLPSKEQETPSFANTIKHVKTPRQTVKQQNTCSKCPKPNKKACFVCGSFSHLIRDCYFHEKRMAKQAEVNKRKCKNTGQRENRPVWNNVNRVNHQKQFVPTAVLTRTGKIQVNTTRASSTNNVNTVRASSTKDVSTARHNFNSQAILTNADRKLNTVKPIVNNDYPQRALKNKGIENCFTFKDYPHKTLQNKRIVDSGCSRHMTRNKAYLAEYQDFNGGPVAFGGSKGNQHKAYCKAKLVSSISHSLQLLHMDLFGPTSVRSLNHKTYCLVITDDFSRSKGIKKEYINARTPQQNGVVERKNRTLIEAARTMLADSFLPNTFWAEAVSTACYVLNRVLVTKPHNKTPYELVTGTKDIFDAGDSEKEVESNQDFFVLPIWFSYSSTVKRSTGQDTGKAPNKHPDLKTDEKPIDKEDQVFLEELERLKRQEQDANDAAEALRKEFAQETEDLLLQAGAAKTSSTNIVNTASTPVSTDIYKNPTDGIFTNSSYNDEGAVVDFTNLESVVNVSPIPTSRINSIHPSTLILGDPQSTVQTRSKVTKSSGAHAFVNPKTSHLSAVKRIFRPTQMVTMAGSKAKSDRNPTTRMFVNFLAGDLFLGNAKSRPLWLLSNLQRQNMLLLQIVVASFMDSKPNNPVYHSKTKHIAIRHHFIRDAYEKKLIQVLKIHTNDNVADLLTKAFDVSRLIGMQSFITLLIFLREATFTMLSLYITAKVAGKPVSISEASIRSDLLFDDADGIDSLPNQAIFDDIQLMGSKNTSWDQIPTNIATAVICLTSNQKYNFSKLIFDDKRYECYVPVPFKDQFPVNALTSKVFSFMVKKGKYFSRKVTPLFASMLVQPTEDEGATSERPSKPQPTPSPPHPSEANVKPQSEPSLRPSPSTHIPDSIPESSGGNHRGQSSSDKSLSGNEGDITLQSVYDLCISLCTQVTDQAKEIKHLKAQIKKLQKKAKPVITHHKAWMKSVSLKKRLAGKKPKESVSKQGRKSTKAEPSVHKDPLFDELPDDTLDYIDTEDAQDVGRTKDVVNEEKEPADDKVSTEDTLSTAQQQVSTDKEKVSTDRPNVSTDRPNVSTDRPKVSTDKEKDSIVSSDEGTYDQTEERSATPTTPTTTPTLFGDDETIAQVLLNISQAKAVSREKEKGVELKDVEETERPRPTSTRSLLTLKPLPKIDPKDKGKKKIEEEDESDTESEGIPEAEKKFKQLARDEEMARKVQEDWEVEEEIKKLAEEEAIKTTLSNEYDFIQTRIEVDRFLALRLQDEEREQFTVEERAMFLHDIIAAQIRFLAEQRAIAIRNKPPRRTKLRNQMMTYLKHVGNKKYSGLKSKTFKDITRVI